MSTRFYEPPGREGGPLVAYLTDVDSHQHLGKHISLGTRGHLNIALAELGLRPLGRGVMSAARERSHLACARPCDSIAPESVRDVLQTLRKGPTWPCHPAGTIALKLGTWRELANHRSWPLLFETHQISRTPLSIWLWRGV